MENWNHQYKSERVRSNSTSESKSSSSSTTTNRSNFFRGNIGSGIINDDEFTSNIEKSEIFTQSFSTSQLE